MIIYGSRMYGKENESFGWATCENCGAFNETKNYNARKWGHLYFIPIIPLGAPVRVIKECSACKNGIHLPEQDAVNLVCEIRAGIADALDALENGESHFYINGEENDCTGYLVGSVELLYCLSAEREVEKMSKRLQEIDCSYALLLVNACSWKYLGEPQRAISAYKEACLIAPDNTEPLLLMGTYLLTQNQLDKAEQIFERVLSIDQDNIDAMSKLLDIYAHFKDFEKMVGAYEDLFEALPELQSDKKFVKAYKKACKKAQRQAVLV